jgi:hypothetical protein
MVMYGTRGARSAIISNTCCCGAMTTRASMSWSIRFATAARSEAWSGSLTEEDVTK